MCIRDRYFSYNDAPGQDNQTKVNISHRGFSYARKQAGHKYLGDRITGQEINLIIAEIEKMHGNLKGPRAWACMLTTALISLFLYFFGVVLDPFGFWRNNAFEPVTVFLPLGGFVMLGLISIVLMALTVSSASKKILRRVEEINQESLKNRGLRLEYGEDGAISITTTGGSYSGVSAL
eukprot:TRINITY_DN1067_c0_g1_i4.p2 TRINITY_DN1067_c0_g1~~TRINITY_DN1067_c0_g1_i4.p2  ORF type:complete len:198 (+),score=29.95 TRINITY_DN1067_c0_g1_i4:61-594(+)